MGVQGSSLRGAAQVREEVLEYTRWQRHDVEKLLHRFHHDVRGVFALTEDRLLKMSGLSEESSAEVFRLLDTDGNKLVDAFEALIAFCLLSQMSITETLDFVFGLYNFGASGEISIDELTILIRTTAHAAAKLDPKVRVLTTGEAESLSAAAFERYGRSVEEELSRTEFDDFVLRSPSLKDFVTFWAHNVFQVAMPKDALWTDEDFPPAPQSLYYHVDVAPPGMIPPKCVTWLRPREAFGEDAQLFDDDWRRFGVLRAGAIGHQWLISVLALVASKPELARSMFCRTGQEDHGRFCIRFLKGTTWRFVVVDDLLPCDPIGQPLFCRGAPESTQLWPSLVEKAYAKLHGCYENIIGGRIENALRDITGGLVTRTAFEEVLQKDSDEDARLSRIWALLEDGIGEGMVGLVRGIREGDRESTAAKSEGIAEGILYILDRVESVRGKRLLRLRYPYHPMRTYTGDWGWYSPTWQSHQEVAADLQMDEEGINGKDDGFFWMDIESCAALFNTVYQVFVEHERSAWFSIARRGSWTKEEDANRAGKDGERRWLAAEQLFLEVSEPGKVLLCLSQTESRYEDHDARRVEHSESKWREEETAIGILVVSHDYGSAQTLRRLCSITKENFVDGHTTMLPTRDVALQINMKPGKYVLLPSRFSPGVEAEWSLTVHSAKAFTLFSEKEVLGMPREAAAYQAEEAAEESDQFTTMITEGSPKQLHRDQLETSYAVALEHLAGVYNSLSNRIFDLSEAVAKKTREVQNLERTLT